MPAAGHLLRIIDIYPPQDGGKRTVMHRTKTLDYVVVIEGEVVLVLDDSEVTLKQSDVVIQRGTDHAWENRSDKVARLVAGASAYICNDCVTECVAVLEQHGGLAPRHAFESKTGRMENLPGPCQRPGSEVPPNRLGIRPEQMGVGLQHRR